MCFGPFHEVEPLHHNLTRVVHANPTNVVWIGPIVFLAVVHTLPVFWYGTGYLHDHRSLS